MTSEENKNKYVWFKAKHFGWGWYPSSWEGWLVMLVWIGLNLKVFLQIDKSSHSSSDTLIAFSLPFIISTIILIAICYKKGEKPKWSWSWKKEN